MLNKNQRAYLAGFLDGDGSVYVRLKPNNTYRFGYQVAPYVVLFQSQKEQKKFEEICKLINLGRLRIRKDGILEYTIGRVDALREFLKMVKPFVILKREQVDLILEILDKKEQVKNKADFLVLAKLIERFRNLNYSKKRKRLNIH
jgi:hypothetical protein